jgi:2-amino-4-hydroxy-6-hydroxymethyldihydropteridine diphosphokinase
MTEIYLLLGGNIGDRLNYLQEAQKQIERKIGKIVQQSSIYETAPWGVENQPNFLNQAIEVDTHLSPQELLKSILEIEISLGRERHQKWYARTIDIDMLLYKQKIIHEQDLIVPHLRLPFRRFGLIPLAEIAPYFIHPQLNKTIQMILEECSDTLEVKKFFIR